MKTIETLKAEQAVELQALADKLALAQLAPVVPDGVQLSKKGTPWLSYRGRTLAQALEIFEAYTVVPMFAARNTCTEIAPQGCYYGKNMTVSAGPFAVSLTVDTGEGFGPNATVIFYGMVGDGVARVVVGIEGPDYIGAFKALAPSVTVERDPRGRVVRRTYSRNVLAASMADDVVAFASGDAGPVKTAANHVYLFCSDTEDRAPGSQNRHACGQLQNLINATTTAGV